MGGNVTAERRGGRRWVRYAALAVALLWAGFWTYFGLGSGLSEGLDPVGIAIHTMVPGLIFLASAIAAWRWEAIGGSILLLEGLAVLVGYPIVAGTDFPIQTIVFVLLTMALPPLVTGTLLLLSWRAARR